jgi:hypothetical protein
MAAKIDRQLSCMTATRDQSTELGGRHSSHARSRFSQSSNHQAQDKPGHVSLLPLKNICRQHQAQLRAAGMEHRTHPKSNCSSRFLRLVLELQIKQGGTFRFGTQLNHRVCFEKKSGARNPHSASAVQRISLETAGCLKQKQRRNKTFPIPGRMLPGMEEERFTAQPSPHII